MYICAFSNTGKFLGATIKKNKVTVDRIRNMYPNTLIEERTEEDFNLFCKGYIRDTDGTPIPYVPPERPLEEVKTAKLTELKNERDTLEVEPVEYNGNYFDFDEKAREHINNAIIALELQEGASLEWTLADNTSTSVTTTDLKNVIGVAAMRSNALHIAYREAKVEVEKATTKEEVETIVLEV